MFSLFAGYDVRSLYEGLGLAISPVTGSLEYQPPCQREGTAVRGTLTERVGRFRQHLEECGGRSYCLASGDHMVLRCVLAERGMQGVVVEVNNVLGYVEGDIAIRQEGFGHREFYLMLTAPRPCPGDLGRATLYARVPPPPATPRPQPPERSASPPVVPEPPPSPPQQPPPPLELPAPRRRSRLSWLLPRVVSGR